MNLKADIIHISGFDTYNTHDSGNYIIFNFLRKLNYNSKMILCLNKAKLEDKDTFFIPKEKVLNSIQKCKVLVFHDTLFSEKEIKKFYEKFNCKIIIITQTHYHLITKECAGNDAHPELNSEKINEYNKKFILEKKEIFKNLPISLVYGSSYTEKITKQYNMYKNLNFIPLPADVPFCKTKKEKVRNLMGLSNDRKIILWGTAHPKTERKGKHLFDKCLDILWDNVNEEDRKQIIILNVGPSAGKFGIKSKFNTIYTGYIQTRKQMSSLYKLSDVSICTTIADAGPMMISESMCNETPVIAFDRSIACDLCVNGETGYLIENLDLTKMSQAIYNTLFIDDLNLMSKKSREKYLSFHGNEKILKKWKILLDTLMP
jgi:glycosyltransferase involved in cell wall biosynthesis